MTSIRTIACGLAVLSGLASTRMAAQSEPMVAEVAPFRSVELRSGGKVTVRYGPTQRVTFLKGSPACTKISTESGGGLLIEKHRSKGEGRCELEIEIVTPELARLAVAHGGTIQSRGSFPRQAEIGVTVDNGGTVDMRAMSVGTVTASVVSGGRIFTKPLTAMTARVVRGGNITYWGDARVTSSIEHGGVIVRETGSSDDDDPAPPQS